MALIPFVVGSDVHGVHQDRKANAAFFKFVEMWKPKIRVLAGDLWDFTPLRKKADDDERRISLTEDYDKGVEWFNRFKPTHFIRGNHDERMWDLAELNRGIESDLAIKLLGEIDTMVRKHRCRMLPYDKRKGVLRLGHLKIIHGFSSGVYASRQTALAYGSCLFGHTHSIDEHAIPGLERRVARNIGCLCKLDLKYNSRHVNTLKQAHGFAYGVLDEKSGRYHVWQAEEVLGKWILANEYIEL